MLSEFTIHECMKRLLKSSSNEKSLECFAKLMTITGTELDKEEAKVWNACVPRTSQTR